MLVKFSEVSGPNFRYLSIKIEDFLTLPPYQGQRKTEKHALRVLQTLEKAPPITLLDVVLVEYPDGTREILDGNSRQFLWENGRLEKPTHLNAKIWFLQNAIEARPYYESYNSAVSAKGARDETVSAMGLCNWVPKSSHCRDATLRSPLCLAEGNVRGVTLLRNVSQYELMPLWMQELIRYDELAATGNTRGRTHTSITASFLMTNRVHGEGVMPFWREWFGENWKGERPDVPINKLYSLMHPPRPAYEVKTGGSNVYKLLQGVIYIVERWVRGDAIIESQRYPDITGYCTNGYLPATKRRRNGGDDIV